MKFEKWHGLGNDFIIIEAASLELPPADLAITLCHRNFGIGADGLVVLEPLDGQEADLAMRIYNSDGSEAEMCGNAIRCVAIYSKKKYDLPGCVLRVRTAAGLITTEIIGNIDSDSPAVRVDMGLPRLECGQIPVAFPAQEHCLERSLQLVDGRQVTITCVSMGNPHCVIFVPDADQWPVDVMGPLLENHAAFPRRTNVEFVSLRPDGSLRMRVWERGAGITMACGTGACATLVAAHLTGRTPRQAAVVLDGGTLEIAWAADNDHLYMTGPATFVYSGDWSPTGERTGQ